MKSGEFEDISVSRITALFSRCGIAEHISWAW